MPLRLRIRAPDREGGRPSLYRVVEFEDQPAGIRFGRRPDVEVSLPFETVSGLHARLERQSDGRWTLTDLGSANGTWVEAQRLTPRAPYALATGTEFRLADVHVRLEGDHLPLQPGAGAPPAESTATIARRLVSDLFWGANAAEVARVVVESGPTAGQSLTLAAPDRAYKVGRGAACELVLPDDDVSRAHASFERSWQGVLVRDLDSKNGVMVTGQRVGERRLRDGETVVVGNTCLRLDDPEDRYLQRMQQEQASVPGGPVSMSEAPARMQQEQASAPGAHVSMSDAPARMQQEQAPVPGAHVSMSEAPARMQQEQASVPGAHVSMSEAPARMQEARAPAPPPAGLVPVAKTHPAGGSYVPRVLTAVALATMGGVLALAAWLMLGE